MAAQSLSPLGEAGEIAGGAEVGQRSLSAHRLSGDQLLFGAQGEDRRPKSLEEVDPELLKIYEKLGIPLLEQERLAGVAVDAVFDSVSVATTFKGKAGRAGNYLLLFFRGGA